MIQPEKIRISFITLGCRVNQYESEAIANILKRDGFQIVPFGEPADVTVVNTCTVTAESDRKSRQHIRRAIAQNPNGTVIVTGCFSEVSPDAAMKIPGVKAVVGNGKKDKIPTLIRKLIEERPSEPQSLLTDIQKAPYDSLVLTVPSRARSYIKIEDGCENRCAYCIIPAARGKIRSKLPKTVLTEAAMLAGAGCPEITLTGIETAAYGKDSGGAFSLTSLLPDLAKIPGIRRIALGSLDPSLMRDSFLETIASLSTVLPHFHLSLQSGSSSVLRRMRRPYNAVQAMDRIEAVRRFFPEAMMTADVIVGFPGETEKEFLETVNFCQSARFMHLHIFPYSIRKGTEAATMPDQVPDAVKKERAAHLAAMQRTVKADILTEYVTAHRHTPVSLLVEEIKNGEAVGHSEHFVEIRVPKEGCSVGDIIDVFLMETDGEICRGTTK